MSQSFELQQEAYCVSSENAVRSTWVSPATAAVAAHLVKRGARAIQEAVPLLTWLANPGEMPQSVFLALQGIEEDMELAVAQGRDCIEGFDGIHGEVARLLEESPWTLHADHGCVRSADIAELDRQAAPMPC